MSELILRGVDPVLRDRIGRVAEARGWTLDEALLRLLEQGLHVHEGDASIRLDGREADALQAAIAALERIPDAPGQGTAGPVPPAE